MDKDMINIDDLFKDRLNDNEEKERPGAWLLMKDLLNEKMPAAVAVGAALYNWRKIYSFFAGAAVIGSVIIGYKAMNKNDGAHKPVAVNTTVVTNSPVSTVNNAINSSNTSKNQQQKEINTATSPVTNNTNNKAAASLKAEPASAIKSLNTNTSIKAHSTSTLKTVSNTPHKNQQQKETNTTNLNSLASGNGVSKPKQGQAQQPSSVNGNQSNSGNTNINNTTIPTAPVASSRQKTSDNQPALPRVQDPKKSNPRYVDRDAKMDSAELIVVKESVRKGKVNVTTTHGMIARAKNNLPETEEDFYNHPAEQATTSSVDEGALVNMKNNKVESKYYKSKGSSSNFFEEMVKNVSVDLSGVSFHGGLMGGINSSLGTYNMAGVQLGVVGMMDINDRWMLFAELKYLQRFGNGKSLKNNYNELKTPVYQGGNITNYQWESVDHYFNISSSSLVELPIAVRYSSKRISFFTGLNTAYNFAVNVEEKENRQLHDYMAPTGTPASTITSSWDKDQPVITTNDFGPRITMGAMLGFGYQVSPAVGIDLRVSQPFWDNVRSKGAYQVSKELYRVPSLQFNLTYRFSNNNYKMR